MKNKVIGKLQSYILPQNEKYSEPDGIVILIHGYGANGRDLLSLADNWIKDMPALAFVSPDAPDECEASSLGRQWFSLQNFDRESKEREIATAWKHLSDYIDAVMDEYKISDDKILLCGFSQGTMMALYTAMKREKPCAGVLGYSGILLDKNLVQTTENKDIPIHLIHGMADTVIPINEWENAFKTLRSNGFKVSGYKAKGLGHGIDFEGIDSGYYFIKDCMYPAKKNTA